MDQSIVKYCAELILPKNTVRSTYQSYIVTLTLSPTVHNSVHNSICQYMATKVNPISLRMSQG